MIALVVAFCAATAFGALSYRHLNSAGCSSALSMFGAALVAGQILAALTTATIPALLLALMVYLIAGGAVAFVHAQTVRNVVLLSGSLALAQAVNPLGPVMAATLVAVLIGLQDASTFRAHSLSLLILLLFVPASSAGFLVYTAQTTHLAGGAWVATNLAQFAAGTPRLAFADFRVQGLVWVIELAAIALPVWAMAAIVRTRAPIAIATICMALIGAVTAAAFLGRFRPVALVAPALAMPSVLTLCERPQARRIGRWVLAAPAFSALLTWFCAELAA